MPSENCPLRVKPYNLITAYESTRQINTKFCYFPTLLMDRYVNNF